MHHNDRNAHKDLIYTPVTKLPPPLPAPIKRQRRADWIAVAVTLFALAAFVVYLSR